MTERQDRHRADELWKNRNVIFSRMFVMHSLLNRCRDWIANDLDTSVLDPKAKIAAVALRNEIDHLAETLHAISELETRKP